MTVTTTSFEYAVIGLVVGLGEQQSAHCCDDVLVTVGREVSTSSESAQCRDDVLATIGREVSTANESEQCRDDASLLTLCVNESGPNSGNTAEYRE